MVSWIFKVMAPPNHVLVQCMSDAFAGVAKAEKKDTLKVVWPEALWDDLDLDTIHRCHYQNKYLAVLVEGDEQLRNWDCGFKKDGENGYDWHLPLLVLLSVPKLTCAFDCVLQMTEASKSAVTVEVIQAWLDNSKALTTFLKTEPLLAYNTLLVRTDDTSAVLREYYEQMHFEVRESTRIRLTSNIVEYLLKLLAEANAKAAEVNIQNTFKTEKAPLVDLKKVFVYASSKSDDAKLFKAMFEAITTIYDVVKPKQEGAGAVQDGGVELDLEVGATPVQMWF